MSLDLLCMGLIALLFGLVLVFTGYKLLWIVLPIWGFFIVSNRAYEVEVYSRFEG